MEQLTVNDIVSPGDILELLRATLDEASTLKAVVIIKIEDSRVSISHAGLTDDYQATGYIEAAKLLLLESDDE